VCARSVSPSESSLWLIDLGRASAVPLTTAPGRNDSPVWSPDGRQIAFAADREGPQHIYVKHVDEAGPERQIDDSSALFKSPNAWTSDGRSILVTQLDADTAQNIYRVSLDNGEAVRLVAGPTIDRSAALSPDGRWLAYSSDQTGRFEVYVQAVSGAGRRVQVSQQSGVAPAWTSDGRALVFVGADQRSVWRADVTVGTAFAVGTPRQTGMLPPGVSSFDFTPDRQRLLTLAPTSSGVGSATVVLNWRAALDDSGR
jgi:eukaryotic-like serine/threonine-protein kinase